MRSSRLLPLMIIVGGVLADTTSAQQPVAKLPGAKATINAIEYPSLQAAIDALPQQGGIVRLPAGEFEVSSPLVIQTGDTRLEGAGAATHIINTNTKGEPAIFIAHADGASVKKEDRLWRVNLANLRVTGNPRSGAGVIAVKVEEIFLQGVTISHNGGDGILLDECYEDPRVSDCLITYNAAVGLHLKGCHDIVVSANQFEENNDALHCIDSFNLCMNGNNLDDHLNRGVVIENTYGSVLSGNMIEECAKAAVTLDHECYGITISANVIAHNGSGVDLRHAHGCAVSGNTFTINKSASLRIAEKSGRITVSGNSFSNSFVGEGKIKRVPEDRSAGGILLESAKDIHIVGNTFAGLTTKPIDDRGDKSRNVVAENNMVVK